MFIERRNDRDSLLKVIAQSPVTLLAGPRQCGKTTLAKWIEPSSYFCLSNSRDAENFIKLCRDQPQTEGVVAVDEIQDRPDVLPLIRQWVDARPNSKFMLLGSAVFMLEAELPKYLLGRMATYHLGGFALDDVGVENNARLWSRGGFPGSYLAPNDEQSFSWRENYIASCSHGGLLRTSAGDSPHLLGPLIRALDRFSGGIVNVDSICRALAVSRFTVQRYLHLLAVGGLIRLINPFVKSAGATLRKNPKLYVRDSGLLACLAGLNSEKRLESHERAPAIWEAYVLENLASALRRKRIELKYWRDRTGLEIDAVWEEDDRRFGAEIRYSSSPNLTKPMELASDALQLSHLWVIHRGAKTFSLADRIAAIPFTRFATPRDLPTPSPRRLREQTNRPSKRIFVSYCHEDVSFVKKLVASLESAAVDVTVDYKTLRLGGSIEEFIKKAVRGTERTIMVVSKNSLRSPWVMAEFLETALYEEFTDKARLIPVHVDKSVFDPNLPLEIDEDLVGKMDEVDDRIREALKRRMDLEPFVGVRTRLRNLQFNVGKAIQRLTSVLSGDFSNPDHFEEGIARIAKALNVGNYE